MIIEKLFYEESSWEIMSTLDVDRTKFQIVLLFVESSFQEEFQELSVLYPNASIIISSTYGNILDTTATYFGTGIAIYFEKSSTYTTARKINLKDPLDDIQMMFNILRKEKNDLHHVLIFLPARINITPLETFFNTSIEGISANLLATSTGYHTSFCSTEMLQGDDIGVCIGLYGSKVHIQTGCESGWYEFGPRRKITKVQENNVIEIDGVNAIELYKRYLGNHPDILSKEMKRFPLSVKESVYDKEKAIRVVLDYDEDGALVFLGTLKEGSIIRLMKTNIHNILDGAFLSAKKIRPNNTKQSVAFVMSCYTRKSVLRQFFEEELEIVQDILTTKTQLVGSYTYGHFSKDYNSKEFKRFQNQSMGLTVLYEE